MYQFFNTLNYSGDHKSSEIQVVPVGNFCTDYYQTMVPFQNKDFLGVWIPIAKMVIRPDSTNTKPLAEPIYHHWDPDAFT